MAFYSIYLIILWCVLVAIKPTRKFTLAITPWLIFACCYDWMRLLPNYKVNPIDTTGLLETERAWFGIVTDSGRLIPGEFFRLHHAAWADFLAGCFYLCWVPVPLGYSLYLWFKGRKQESLRMSIAFLWVNLMGFALYYVHPAAPPWYTIKHGSDIIFGTPGGVGELYRFDELIGVPVFAHIYSGNANVFAALPSLHSAYVLVAAIYAIINKSSKWTVLCFFAIQAGIWCTAVYTCHHYVIDVLCGIATGLVSIAILEYGIYRIPCVKRGFEKYVALL